MDPVLLCCAAIIIVLFSLITLKVYRLFRSESRNVERVRPQQQQQQPQRAPISRLQNITLFYTVCVSQLFFTKNTLMR